MPVAMLAARSTCYCNKCYETKPETDFSETARAQHRLEDENAMCQDCVTRLYKGKLARDEVSAYIREDRERLLRLTRNPDYEEMTGPGRLGKIMHHDELFNRLKKIVPNLVVTASVLPNNVSFYQVRGDSVQFVCWSMSGWMPEFSVVEFNKDRQPIHEIRGWRTVLLRFIKSGVVTEKSAETEFERPSSPQQARFWARELYDYRNRK